MSRYSVTQNTSYEIEFDFDDIIDHFDAYWLDEDQDPEEFIRDLISEYGFDYLLELDLVYSYGPVISELEIEKI